MKSNRTAMAPVSLPCVMGVGVCSFKTMELEYEQANEQLGTHMKFAHNQYKEEYNLSGKGLIRQLHACCSTELKTSLSRITCGKQFEQTEPSLMKLMKQLAVRPYMFRNS